MKTIKLTINEIAKLASVSRTTVSRVLNNKSDVNEETRKRVLEIIDEHNYRPSIQAKRTILQKINNIGLVLMNSLDNIFISPLNSEIIKGVLTKAGENGFDITICTDSSPVKLLHMFNEKRFDGYIILNPNDFSGHMLEVLKNNEIPFVATSYYGAEGQYNCVDIDNFTAAYQMTEYLILNGHKRIGVIKGPGYFVSTKLRIGGYMKCLENYSLAYDKTLIFEGNNNFESGIECTRQILKASPDVTAIFAFSDYMALSAIRYLNQNGYNVPENMSVVGFDDIIINDYYAVALTTVRQSGFIRGYKACQNLLEILSGVDPSKCEFVAHELMVRSTVKPH